MAGRIPIVLITGFLGAGKTTLLNHLIKARAGGRIGLLINDFGSIAVDGSLLRAANPGLLGDDGSIYEIANGSVFCSCLSAAFVLGLKYFAVEEPDVLYIETSGLSDPSGMGKLLRDNGLDRLYGVGSVVGVTDPVKTPKLLRTLETAMKQVRSATHLVINKTDTASPEAAEALAALLREANPEAEIIRTSYGAVDPSLLLPRPDAFARTADCESCNTPENRPSQVLLPQRRLSRKTLEAFFAQIRGKVLRLKGFYDLEGKLYYVSDGNDEVSFEPVDRKFKVQTGISVLCERAEESSILKAWEGLDEPRPPL